METPLEQRVRDALEVAEKYGQIDGSHHKMWTIDKMVKILCGSKQNYDKFVEDFEDENGEHVYTWDTGIAP
jgi:hypothetical protein